MKKRLGILLVPLFLLSSCGIKINLHYDNAESYLIGDATISESITDFNIDWAVGKVEFKTHEEDTIEIKDECVGTLKDDNKLHYLIEDGTLLIKYRKSSLNNVDIKATKNLIITIPNSAKYSTILIDSISANIEGFLFAETVVINDISGTSSFSTNSDNFVCNNVSGNCNVTFSNSPSNISVNTVSGNAEISLPNCNGFTTSFSSISGNYNISEEFENAFIENNVIKYGDNSTSITFNSTSGSLVISK